MSKKSQLKTVKTRIEQGLCPRCGKPNNGNFYYCLKCNNLHNAMTLKRRLIFLLDGKCIDCGKKIDNEKSMRCNACLDIKKLSRARLRAEQLKNGICTSCGEKNDIKGSWNCSKCREKLNKRKRELYKKKKDEILNNGE